MFTAFANPFSHTLSKLVKVSSSNRSPTFGFTLATDTLNNRVFVERIAPSSMASTLFGRPKTTNNKIRGAYIVAVNDVLVFTKEEAVAQLRKLFDSNASEFSLTFAPEKKLNAAALRRALLDHKEHSIFEPNSPDSSDDLELSLEHVRSIASLLHDSRDLIQALPSDALHFALNAISSDSITPEESALGSFTRRKLKRLSTWPQWQAGEFQQLDRMHALGMYGEPVDPPPNAIVLRQHWQYKIKRNGVRRSRNCCDGSPTAAPLLHKVASTYSSCVEQPVQRLFFALAALLNYNVYGGDATDAFAHSPPPDTPTFVHIDDAYAEWYQARHHVPLDRSKVLPVLHALQGHPESGRLWEHYINAILSSSELVFSTTTHDRCIYTATFDNTKVLLLRQVDDFCLAAPSESFARQIFGIIGRKLQQPNEATPPFEYLGLITDYNGVDVNQTSHYIELTSTGYISRLLRSHGWDTPASKQSANDHVSPLPVDAVHRVYSSALGPPEHTPEHAELEHTQGFSYRTLLGELLFVYITCRPDIGYAVVTLSKFAASPSPLHYQFLKGVAKYLRRTSTWGLRFHRTSPVRSVIS
jgi:hypothetical protein